MHLPITILTNLIIETYFRQTRCLLIFTDSHIPFDYFGTMPTIIFSVNDAEIDPETVFNNFGCQGFVVNVENPRSMFENIEKNIRMTMERYNNRRYLFVSVDNAVENGLDVFESEAAEYVADMDVIIKRNSSEDDQENFDIISHRYGGVENHKSIIVLDRWFSTNQSFLFKNDLYPNKLLNQYGRTLRLGTIYYVPYSVIDSLDGLDISILMELAKKLNMTIKLVLDTEVQWGEIFSNFTGNGILGNLVMDRTDIGFASMFIWEAQYHYLDISKQTIKSSISCLAPAPKLLGGWATPFFAFNTAIWIVFAITVMISIVTLYFALSWKDMRRVGSYKTESSKYLFKSIILTEAMYLNQSLWDIPKDFSSRLVFSMILMMSLVLGAIYDSGLASIMTIPRYGGIIKNPRDMINHQIQWGATEDAWILSIQSSESSTHKGIVQLFVMESEEKLAKRNEDRKFAFAIERLQGGNFAVGTYITEDGAKIRRILNEDLYFDYMAFYMRKSSILLPYLDDIILRVAQAGLLEVWEYNAIARYSNTKIQKIIKDSVHPKRPGPTQLKFSHVEGAFTILIVGLLIALVCFIGELLMFHYY